MTRRLELLPTAPQDRLACMARVNVLKVSTPWIHGGIVAFVLVVYSPVIFIDYAFEDSYAVLAAAMQEQLAVTLDMIVWSGRPLAAVFTKLAFEAARGIDDLGTIRAIGVVGIGVVCAMVFHALSQTRLPPAACIAAALLFGLTPPFQVYAAWAVASVYPWACALAGWAFITADRAGNLRSDWIRLAGSTMLLTASLAIYQPAAMMFWNFAAIAWLLRPQLPAARSVLTSGGVMASALALEFIITKFLPRLLFDWDRSYSRVGFVHDYLEKLRWFFQEPLFSSLNLFRIDATVEIAGAAAVLIFGGLLLFFGRGFRQAAVRMTMAACLIPLAYLPNLLVEESWASYRTQIALTGLIFIYLVAALTGWVSLLKGQRLLPAMCAVGVIAGALTAVRNVTLEFAIPQVTEYRLVESALLKMKFGPTDEICFDLPKGQRSYAPVARYDEFGTLSSGQPWVPDAMAWLIMDHDKSPYAAMFLPVSASPPVTKLSPGCKEIDLDTILPSLDDDGAPSD